MFFEDQDDAPQSPPSEPRRESQAPLLLQDMQSPEEAFGLPPTRRHPRQVVVAVLLVAGAVACIFAMRQFGLGPATALAEFDVQYRSDAVTNSAAAGHILADLERSRRAVQVPAERIKSDPFELAATAAPQTPRDDADARSRLEAERRAEQERLAAEARAKTLNDAFGKLHLQSVMEGSVPVARISDQVVRVGMKVGEHFTVASIEGREVTLTADGRTFTLTIDADAVKPRGRR